MPTLHLIDADSTQACPAVFSAIRAAMSGSDNQEDHLLILGAMLLRQAAERAGVQRADYIPVPFGRATLGLYALRRWWHDQNRFDRLHCWSPGALSATAIGLTRIEKQLTLVHTPPPRWFKRLNRLSNPAKSRSINITAGNVSLANQLRDNGIHCEHQSIPLAHQQTTPMPATDRRSLRAGWGIRQDNDRVVAPIMDHLQLVDAIPLAMVVLMAGAAMTKQSDNPPQITLLLHPKQLNRRRAEELLQNQPINARVVQDVRVVEPWHILGACDAALALGQDAGGLNLQHALNQSPPIITPKTGPAAGLEKANGTLRLAPSAEAKDLAHQLCVALVE